MERRHTNLIFRGRNRPIRIAFIYMICGLAWVGVSDWVLGILPAHSVDLNRLVFVAVNAVILYVVASRYAARIQLRVTAEREIAARSRGYFESSVEGIVSIDQQGIIRQANPRALEMFGYSDIELVGHPIEVLMPNRIRERHLVHRASFFANPRSRRMGQGLEVIARRKDGSEFPAEVSLNFVQTERGDLVV
ncbi:MAG TPA: PAS domain S-box protein, partial [Candidatus Binataceae bacterium]